MDLHWLESEDGKSRWLYVGLNGAAVAWLEKRSKWWSASIWLPGCRATKNYGPLEQQVTDVEEKVRQWFGMAMTARPAMDSDSEDTQ